MRPVVHLKAGKIVVVKFTAAGILDLTDPTKFVGANGTVENIKPNVEIQTAELPDGNSNFPMGVYDTGHNGIVDVRMSSFQAGLYAALMGIDKEAESGENMWASDEDHTIGDDYKVELENTVAVGGTIVVLDNTGSPFVSASSGPAASQFTVSGDELTFNSVDANKEVFVTYEHASVTSERIALPNNSTRPALHAIISTLARSEDETAEYPCNIILDKCKVAGSLAPPPHQKTPEGWGFQLKVLKPRSGFNPVYWRYKTS